MSVERQHPSSAFISTVVSALHTGPKDPSSDLRPRLPKSCARYPTASELVLLPTGPPLKAYTFALFDSGTMILPNPALFEDDQAHGSLSLVSFVVPPQPDAKLCVEKGTYRT
ncbi:hypothetical protein PTTG_29390 [Puccinia triticina 1-1 BBBD Race 1]|uniref:Uncharacterized protein n=2 Tax=Puccinia triticina TaxID=208348 RepID=A0A180G4N1_PUCT1|nr:uncharacterized protein PtA15_10A523 [Puccinia triticina]OAV87558.1 hypothetical protein PTTG_29390 [Puccinia triticina 1-1 BBBD Race 1]WAQ89099.1 hypothetical protein PtA15_10A523 [Puccinia triticina]WAR59159.1 hypothetical protein PtB15_10B501 [Puccinia triticina]